MIQSTRDMKRLAANDQIKDNSTKYVCAWFYTGMVCNNKHYHFVSFCIHLNEKVGPQSFICHPNVQQCNRSFSSELFLIVLFNNKWLGVILSGDELFADGFIDESFLDCPSIFLKRGCGLYNRKGHSVFPSSTNGTIMVYCHILKMCVKMVE